MTRIACKLGLVAAIVLGVAYFAAAPAQRMNTAAELSPHA